jgi:hypothetical protein
MLQMDNPESTDGGEEKDGEEKGDASIFILTFLDATDRANCYAVWYSSAVSCSLMRPSAKQRIADGVPEPSLVSKEIETKARDKGEKR